MVTCKNIGVLVVVFVVGACSHSSNKADERPIADKEGGICAPLALTPLDLPCLQIAGDRETQQVTLLRSADGLQEIYSKYKLGTPECAAPTIPPSTGIATTSASPSCRPAAS